LSLLLLSFYNPYRLFNGAIYTTQIIAAFSGIIGIFIQDFGKDGAALPHGGTGIPAGAFLGLIPGGYGGGGQIPDSLILHGLLMI